MTSEVKYLYPSHLLFTVDSILPTFPGGTSIHKEIEQIKETWFDFRRKNAMEKFLPLEVGKDSLNGNWYCNNNRKLYFFRVLEKEGLVGRVRVRNHRIINYVFFSRGGSYINCVFQMCAFFYHLVLFTY